MKMNRRKFVASAAAVAGAPALHTGKGGPLGANDRVICGFIGTGGMGRSNMRDFLRSGQVRAAAVCDVWDHNCDLTLQMTADQEGGKAAGYKDFRQVLDLKEVDVVVVSTPDHWHALPTVMACDAGKDVYVEKPLSLTIYEGRKMVEAARRNGRVVQMGTQQRSGKHFQEAVKLVREGAIGKVSRVNTWNYGNESPAGMGHPPDTEPPPGLDWDFWLGPGAQGPFQRQPLHPHFPVVLGLLGRDADRLGNPSSGHRPVGHAGRRSPRRHRRRRQLLHRRQPGNS